MARFCLCRRRPARRRRCSEIEGIELAIQCECGGPSPTDRAYGVQQSVTPGALTLDFIVHTIKRRQEDASERRRNAVLELGLGFRFRV